MRTAQPTRPAVRARMFWPRQPASRVTQAPANAVGRLPYLPLGCACLFLLGLPARHLAGANRSLGVRQSAGGLLPV